MGLFDATVRFWRSWLAKPPMPVAGARPPQRSAITLKLMTYAPSGGLVAAPTAALPEQIGGERNWDYRYTDSRRVILGVFAARSRIHRGGCGLGQVRARVDERISGSGRPLNIMYRVDGSSDLIEETLPHWEGYRGSKPVRIGNGAADQLQLDIYGEAIDSFYRADQQLALAIEDGGASAISWMAHGQLEPAGRGHLGDARRPAEFTYGRLMSWSPSIEAFGWQIGMGARRRSSAGAANGMRS